jgi:hypothetical protein
MLHEVKFIENFLFKRTGTLIIIEDLVVQGRYIKAIMAARECSVLEPSAGLLGVLHDHLVTS